MNSKTVTTCAKCNQQTCDHNSAIQVRHLCTNCNKLHDYRGDAERCCVRRMTADEIGALGGRGIVQ